MRIIADHVAKQNNVRKVIFVIHQTHCQNKKDKSSLISTELFCAL